MGIVSECRHKIIQAKVKKLIWKTLDQQGITSSGLRVLCKKKVAELKSEHDYHVMSWVGRAVTILIKEDRARIAFDDTGELKFFACS